MNNFHNISRMPFSVTKLKIKLLNINACPNVFVSLPDGPVFSKLTLMVFTPGMLTSLFITCSAMILDADWSIGVISGAVHPLQIQYHTAEFKTTTWSTNLIDITTLTA